MKELRFSTSIGVRVRVVVFNATFNNISAISWQSVLLVEETGVPEKILSSTHHLTVIITHNVSGDRH
jgi:hypothetical protein